MYRPYIYVASRNTDGLVKPGYSWEPEKRIRRFGQNTPEGAYAMSLLYKRLMPTVDATIDNKPNRYADMDHMDSNAKAIERKLKEVFIDFHIRGEWFQADCAQRMVRFLRNHSWKTTRITVDNYAWNKIQA